VLVPRRRPILGLNLAFVPATTADSYVLTTAYAQFQDGGGLLLWLLDGTGRFSNGVDTLEQTRELFPRGPETRICATHS